MFYEQTAKQNLTLYSTNLHYIYATQTILHHRTNSFAQPTSLHALLSAIAELAKVHRVGISHKNISNLVRNLALFYMYICIFHVSHKHLKLAPHISLYGYKRPGPWPSLIA